MSDDARKQPRMGPARDDEIVEYRAVSGLAVATLLLGLFSAAALLDPWCWGIPVVALGLGAVALWRIARRASLTGRGAAVIGMGLALAFGSVAVAYSTVERYTLRGQARQTAEDFFACLTHGKPQLAFQFLRQPSDRPPLDSDLWAEFRADAERRDQLSQWVERPVIKTLLLLGDQATVRYCGTEAEGKQDGRAGVSQVFTVTYNDPKRGRTTFYVRIRLGQGLSSHHSQTPWMVLAADGGIHPAWTAPDESTEDLSL